MQEIDSSCPYENLPDTAYWAKSVRDIENELINPATEARFQIDPSTKIGTIGSCFAQNIAQHLVKQGFSYFVTEEGPPWLSAEEKRSHGYGVFSARYGNVYNTLQLLQVLDRSTGQYNPDEKVWPFQNGYADPFRPYIEPSGFSSESELLEDRKTHLNAVRTLFHDVDVLIVTLGLTESWVSNITGTAFPLCPGCGAGQFDQSVHEFKNFGFSDVTGHLNEFITRFHDINPDGKILFTVSPVPLVATYEPHHVLQSTVYSKSVLRAAVEDLKKSWSFVDYFPSFEIITWTLNNPSYYQPNKRSVSDIGVTHVMKCFFEAYTEHHFEADLNSSSSAVEPVSGTVKIEGVDADTSITDDDVVCDEERVLDHLSNHERQR